MSDQLTIQCGPAGDRGRRLVDASLGGKSHRDRFDTDSEFHRREFREKVVDLFMLGDDAHEWVDSEIIRAADKEDVSGQSLWQPSVVSFADIKPMMTTWLWENYLPAGTIAILDGNAGLGKSQLTIDLAARLSRGDAMPPLVAPDRMYTPRGTLILNAEDDPDRTIRPRLDAAGAVISKVHLLRHMAGFDGEEQRPVSLPIDLPSIEEIVRQHDIALVILDPFVAYLDSKLSMNSDADVRRCLGQVAAMAERTGVCVLLVRHLNKKSGQAAIHRGGGSVGITGAARAAFLVGADPEDKDQRVLAPVKCNLAPEPPSLAFSIESKGTTSRIRWGNEIELTATDLLQPEKQSSKSKIDLAKAIIEEALARGPRGEGEVLAACEGEGISRRTYWRARKAMGIEAEKAGFDEGWMLSLPSNNGNGFDVF